MFQCGTGKVSKNVLVHASVVGSVYPTPHLLIHSSCLDHISSCIQDIELLETLLLRPQDPNAVGEALMQSCDSLGAVK